MKADLILRNANLVNVLTSEIYVSDICLKDGRIAGFDPGCGAASEMDCAGKYVTPAFIEGHIHLESLHVLPGEISAPALANGVTAMICDPHEIANAGGAEGIEFLLSLSEDEKVDYFFMLPSCVPASSFETSGADFGPDKMKSLMSNARVIGLGEVMDYVSVISEDPALRKKLDLFEGGVIDGHCPGLRGRALDDYIRHGIYSDHETEDPEEALEKIRKGMYLMIRSGSTTDSSALLRLIHPGNDSRFMIVSDDNSPGDLYASRFLLHRLRKMSAFSDPLTIVKGLTVNPAAYFRMYDRGSVSPGKKADLLIFDDLAGFDLRMTIKDGAVAYDRDAPAAARTRAVNPERSGRFSLRPFTPEDFAVEDKGRDVRVIGIRPGSILTDSLTERLKGRGGRLFSDIGRDIVKCAVIERYSGKSGYSVGFIKGSGLKKGALATTFNHDAHNVFVMGADDALMAGAVNRLREAGGGICFSDGQREELIPLNIYGIISGLPLSDVADTTVNMERLMKDSGVAIDNPLTLFSFMSLSVIPRLKITDRCLVEDNREAGLYV